MSLDSYVGDLRISFSLLPGSPNPGGEGKGEGADFKYPWLAFLGSNGLKRRNLLFQICTFTLGALKFLLFIF
jgi:hypothetical protein